MGYDKELVHLIEGGVGVPFCLESLLAQYHIDSGDKIPWSVLKVTHIGDVYCNGIG